MLYLYNSWQMFGERGVFWHCELWATFIVFANDSSFHFRLKILTTTLQARAYFSIYLF